MQPVYQQATAADEDGIRATHQPQELSRPQRGAPAKVATVLAYGLTQPQRAAAEDDDAHVRGRLAQQAAHRQANRVVADVAVPVAARNQDQRSAHHVDSLFFADSISVRPRPDRPGRKRVAASHRIDTRANRQVRRRLPRNGIRL